MAHFGQGGKILGKGCATHGSVDPCSVVKRSHYFKRIWIAMLPRFRFLFVIVLIALGAALWWLPRLLYGPEVAVLKLAPHPLTQTIVTTGHVSSAEESRLGATLTGRVLATPVAEGAVVAAGAVLLVLESDEAQATLAQAEGNAHEAAATQAEAERQFARQSSLLAQGFISRAALDAEDKKVRLARARVAVTQAAVTAARARLEQTRILAPAAGRLIAREVEAGDIVSAGKPVLTFAAAGKTEIRLDVDERYLAQLKVGQVAKVAADAWPDALFSARLVRIAPQVDLERGTLEAILLPDTLPAFLTHNMTVSAEIVVARKAAALTVPAAAVFERGGKSWLWRVREGKAGQVAVVTGMVADGMAEIKSGLAAGDLVVLPGAPALSLGDKVRVKEQG
ncbi:efflux RND transporter periplasmic adaptor subunit [Aquitalea sp. S1-19]|nr:efflux RND transporter periplasmic adaptor subunit [Aquitalea sp. S1-19]